MRVELFEDPVYGDIFDVFFCERGFGNIFLVELDIDRSESISHVNDISQTFDFYDMFFVVNL